MKSLAIFDFCETLVSIQTADKFVSYVKKKENIKTPYIDSLIRLLFKTKIIYILNYIFKGLNLNKRLLLLGIRGVSLDKLVKYSNEFFTKYLQENINKKVIDIMMNHQNSGDDVIIISGGYSIYLKIFCDFYKVDSLYSTEIVILNNKVSGIFFSDCMFKNKVKSYSEYIKKNKIDYCRTYFYTDSISDESLLKLVTNPVVISSGQHQIWAKKYEEIII